MESMLECRLICKKMNGEKKGMKDEMNDWLGKMSYLLIK